MTVRYARGDADNRPWGRWEVLDVGERFCVKRITVAPGGKLSVQRHQHREEHWVIVEGVAEARLGDDTMRLGPSDRLFIPKGAIHAISNPGERPMEFVEVQWGENLDENDIERLEDVYGRS